jgi:hypothetical protein
MTSRVAWGGRTRSIEKTVSFSYTLSQPMGAGMGHYLPLSVRSRVVYGSLLLCIQKPHAREQVINGKKGIRLPFEHRALAMYWLLARLWGRITQKY